MTSRLHSALIGAALIALAPLGASAADYTPGGADTCLKCHDADREVPVLPIFATPHGQPGDARTPFADKRCETCHGPGGEHAKRLKRGEERPPLLDFDPRKHDPAELDRSCLGCHDDRHRADWQGSAHQRGEVACVACHQVHAAHDPMREPAEQVARCTTCHRSEGVQLRQVSSHPLRDGAMACTDCHAPHGARSAEGALRAETVNQLCFDCHAEKRGPFLWEHQPASEDCTTCHRPHGSNNPALLERRAPLLCQGCHSASGHPSVAHSPNGLPSGTPSAYLLARSCSNCHSQVHGSNHPSGALLNR
jgi:DmsE family decaheme c-type cytochrome